jgi:nucleoside-diphosphate-sugar epimerase
MELKDKAVLVTGANGFVGSYVARRLRQEGLRVRALVRRPESQAELEALGVETLLGELTDPSAQAASVRGVHCVVHCAATAAAELPEARRVNAEATRTLAEAALSAGCERFVHISTVAVYPLRNRQGVVDEASPLTTEGDAYGLTKAEAERALSAVAARGLRTVILRPAVILGVHPTSSWGVVFPRLIQAGQFPLVEGGQARLAYLHISGLTDAVVSALCVEAAVGEAFNLAEGHTHWRQYLDAFSPGPLPAVPPEQVPDVLSFRGSFSVEKAQRVLGFVPRDTFESSMAEILRALPKA